MNGKIAKLIRKASKELPNSVIEKEVVKRMHKKEVPEADREAVSKLPGNFVMYKKNVLVPVNHARLLKQYYLKHGSEHFIEEYIKWFQPHHLAMITKYPDKVDGVLAPQTAE